jgi:transketolase
MTMPSTPSAAPPGPAAEAPPDPDGGPDSGLVTDRIREHIVTMCAGPEGGHLGGSMSLVEILTTLYFDVLRVDPAHPADPGRDILILSKGHGAIALYAVLAERGFFPPAELAGYGRPGSRLMGHPVRAVPGVEMATGSLGHGLPLANGFAIAGPDRRCFVIVGDGELQEGSVWEAAMSTAGLGLDNVTVIVDRNGLQITGRTEDTVPLEPLADRWAAFGWAVRQVDGHDRGQLREALTERVPGRPVAVIARTVKGNGLPAVQGKVESHYARLGERQFTRAIAVLRARARRRVS